MLSKEIKAEILDYLKYERDERKLELQLIGGSHFFDAGKHVLEEKTDQDLINMIDAIVEKPKFREEFEEYRVHMDHEDDLTTLYCDYVWECIANPTW